MTNCDNLSLSVKTRQIPHILILRCLSNQDWREHHGRATSDNAVIRLEHQSLQQSTLLGLGNRICHTMRHITQNLLDLQIVEILWACLCYPKLVELLFTRLMNTCSFKIVLLDCFFSSCRPQSCPGFLDEVVDEFGFRQRCYVHLNFCSLMSMWTLSNGQFEQGWYTDIDDELVKHKHDDEPF